MGRETRVLFVCLGNICRSPTAQATFQHLVNQRGLASSFVIDSAGTSGEHDGEGAHRGTQAEARRRGVALAHVSRRVTAADYDEFDLLVAMDQSNFRELVRRAPHPQARQKIVLFRDFEAGAPPGSEVPDPWYSGQFALVFDMCLAASEGLLDAILAGPLGGARERD